METIKTTSLVDMAMGAIKERIDYETCRVVENIKDLNTRAAKKRSIIVQIDILPDDNRERLQVSATVKSKLEATSPITTALYLTEDGESKPVAVEMGPQIPGQTRMDGTEQSEPAVLRLVGRA